MTDADESGEATDDPIDATVVVERSGRRGSADRRGAGDETVVSRRRGTVPAPDTDETVVGRAAARARAAAPTARPTSPNRARRTRIVLPEGTAASLRAADGVGPGAVEPYAPRQVPPAPAAVAPLATGAVREERTAASAVPSVLRATRRASIRALAATLVACAVTVVGVTAILLLR